MRIFIISLAASQDRRSFMADQLHKLKLDYEFVDGVIGRDYYDDPAFYDKAKALRIEKRSLTPGELGCALSHQKIYRQIINDKLPYALIFEDDAEFSPDLPKVLSSLEPMIKPNDFIQLERCDVYHKRSARPLFGPYRLVKPRMILYGSMCQSAGYIITKEAAARILSVNFPVYVPADSWGQYRKTIHFLGLIPTLTLIKQNVNFACTTQAFQRSEFTPSTAFSLLLYSFKTRWRLGRALVAAAKRLIAYQRPASKPPNDPPSSVL